MTQVEGEMSPARTKNALGQLDGRTGTESLLHQSCLWISAVSLFVFCSFYVCIFCVLYFQKKIFARPDVEMPVDHQRVTSADNISFTPSQCYETSSRCYVVYIFCWKLHKFIHSKSMKLLRTMKCYRRC